ncbi:hypothetical protein [Acuticoccus kandeliae]|uniref:hypothetical protein n=1 Tax=Acuticoccus kandeliae TaxID=2073160 RepID=UPI000D3E4B0D|nr:hypothetical protein [Acuticoccus kandeliae]
MALATVLGSCAARDSQQAAVGKDAIVGLTKTQVRMCAGLPTKTVTADGAEIWSYERVVAGGSSITLPTVPSVVPIPGPSFSQANSAYCHAQVRFKENKAIEVAYAGATAVMGAPDAACAQIVQGCVRYVAPPVEETPPETELIPNEPEVGSEADGGRKGPAGPPPK